jgi:hypothetical protein
VRAHTFCIYVLHIQLTSIVETVRLFRLDAELRGLFKCARMIKGHGSALLLKFRATLWALERVVFVA